MSAGVSFKAASSRTHSESSMSNCTKVRKLKGVKLLNENCNFDLELRYLGISSSHRDRLVVTQ